MTIQTQTQTQTIKFLDLQKINQQYKTELLNACEQVINSGWYIRGEQNKIFEKNLEVDLFLPIFLHPIFLP